MTRANGWWRCDRRWRTHWLGDCHGPLAPSALGIVHPTPVHAEVAVPVTKSELRAPDTAYCVAVSANAVCLVSGAILRQSVSLPTLGWLVPVLAFSLAGLFVVGVGLQIAYRRYSFTPRLCELW